MPKMNHARRPGRKRWGPLVKFLTNAMQTSTNEKVRMSAAERLTDILTLRERRDQLEIKRELRLPISPQEEQEAEETPPVRETAEQFLERVRAMKAT